mgnify:CR=1 FL=1
MPIKKISSKERKSITKKWFTIDEVRAAIFAEQRPSQWRPGQFVFNRASALYGDNFVRSIGHDPFYNDEKIVPFIEESTEALNKLN